MNEFEKRRTYGRRLVLVIDISQGNQLQFVKMYLELGKTHLLLQIVTCVI